jgi:hypothetical protein
MAKKKVILSLIWIRSMPIIYSFPIVILSELFFFKIGRPKEYSFLQEKQKENQVNINTILESFNARIKNYNKHITDNKDRINFKPSFIASQSGLICIIGMSLLAVVASYLHLLYQARTSLISRPLKRLN